MVVSGDAPYEELNRTARALRDRILSVKDVSSVDLIGDRDRQIVVDADRDRLEGLGIAVSELLRAVQQKNVTVPGGTLETSSREYLLRTVGSLQGISKFENVIVRSSSASGGVAALATLPRYTRITTSAARLPGSTETGL